MKASLTSFILFVIFSAQAFSQNTYYSAAKAGLNLREKPDVNSAAIAKIPYGEKMTFIDKNYSHTLITEGMAGYWIYVSYGNYTGYVADIYTLPFPPPNNPTSNALKDYVDKLNKVVYRWTDGKNPATNTSSSGGIFMEKVAYGNGIVYRSISGYEWGNETIWLPNFTMEKAFVLARLILSSSLLSTSDAFPKQSRRAPDNSEQKDILVMSIFAGNEYPMLIRFEECTSGCEWIEIREEYGEVSITVGSGV